jgi:hypothetical protein
MRMLCIAVGGAVALLAATIAAPPAVAADGAQEVQQVRLSWTGDPATTMTIRWRNPDPNSTAAARFRALGATQWLPAAGTTIGTGPAGNELQVELTELAPGSSYEYQLPADVDVWTAPRRFTTAPPAGGEFRVAFVADTGVAGRLDGLANGTEHVIAAIEAIDPLFVLGGGDYAYADNDQRFANPAEGIDAWLDMMSPLIAERAFMPTYGNHEVLLEQSLDLWVERLATPDDGFGGRSSYSFDVAGVHFVSLLAYEGVLDQATLDWLAADLDAATARGVRTIVPYMHRNVYGDGTAHAPSPSLARQLAAVFDRYDIDVVLTAHDQSYERTFPLTGGTPTTGARRCYTKADGITWIKTSPGGKLSNVSSGFSPYSATPPNPLIAVRENALHHFSLLTFGAGGIEVATYGVSGDGSPPHEIDRVSYRESCPPELAFVTLPVTIEMSAPGPATVDAALSPANAPVQLSTDADWATASLGSDGHVSVAVDGRQLPPGTHVTQVVATAEGYEPASLPVVVTIPDPNAGPVLVLYPTSARGQGSPLEGARLSGEAYIALQPPVGSVDYVQFVLDGSVVRTENQPPFDLVGGADEAAPLDTSTLADGAHTLEAVVVGADGVPTTVTAQFEVAQGGAAVPPVAAGQQGSESPGTQVASSRMVTPVERDDWWTSPLALGAAALLAGVALGLAGRIGTQRARSNATGEVFDYSPPRAYESTVVGRRSRRSS